MPSTKSGAPARGPVYVCCIDSFRACFIHACSRLDIIAGRAFKKQLRIWRIDFSAFQPAICVKTAGRALIMPPPSRFSCYARRSSSVRFDVSSCLCFFVGGEGSSEIRNLQLSMKGLVVFAVALSCGFDVRNLR